MANHTSLKCYLGSCKCPPSRIFDTHPDWCLEYVNMALKGMELTVFGSKENFIHYIWENTDVGEYGDVENFFYAWNNQAESLYDLQDMLRRKIEIVL